MLRSSPGKRLIPAIFVVFTGLLVFIFLLYKEIHELNNSAALVAHTNQVLFQSERVLSALQYNATGVHNYVLTGKSEYLEPLGWEENDVPAHLGKLRELVSDTEGQRAYLDSLAELVNRSLQFSEQLIADRRKKGIAAVTLLVPADAIHTIDLARKVLRHIQTNEKQLLADRQKLNTTDAEEASNELLLLAGIAAILFALFIIALSRFLRSRQVQERQNTYAAALVNNVQDAIISTDKDLLIRSWNKAAEQLYGWKAEEVVGKNGPQLMQTRFKTQTSGAVINNLVESGYFRGEVEQVTKSGKRVLVQANSSAMYDEKGAFMGAVSVNRDITEQKMMERELLELNSKLEEKIREKVTELSNVFERIRDGFIALDRNWNYTYVNKKAAEMLNLTPAEMMGKNIWELFPATVHSGLANAYRRAMEQQEFTSVEAYYVSLELWLENHIYPSHDGISVFFRDITHRKQTEEDLRISKERYDFLSKTTSDSIFDWDLVHNELFRINKSIEEIFGYPRVEAKDVDAFWEKTAHPDDWPEVMRKRKEIFADPTKNMWEDEYRFRRNTGEYGYIRARGYVIRDASGKAIRSIGASQDITEKRKAEDALQKSELLFRTLVEKGPEVIVMIDAGGQVIYVSPSSEKVLGYQYQDRVGKSALEHIHPEDIPSAKKALYKLSQQPGATDTAQWRHLHADGSWHWIDGTASNQLHDPAIRAIVLNFRDVTRQKEEEDQLRLLESVVTHANDGVVITEAEPIDGEDHPKIVYVNKSFTKTTGYTAAEVIGKTPRILQGPDTDRHELDRLRQHLQKWEPCEVEVINYRKNGEPFWHNISISPLADRNGWFTYWIAIQRDVTERKKVEEELRQKNTELKRLSDYLQNIREKERQSIAIEVHEELGQLVSALKIDVDWLTLKMADEVDAIAEKRVAHANKIMTILIQTIRQMAKNLRPSVLDDFGLNEALQWHCSDFEMLNGVVCTFESDINDAQLPQKIAVELFRIVQETLANVRAHAKAESVTVSLQQVTQGIQLRIADDGVGFDTAEVKNTLGLVGLRERAASLNGELHIESQPGKGTRVEAWIPL